MVKFIEFPIFTGVAGELRPWISWLEAFFVREKFTADEKLNLAQSLLEGKAEVWFYRTQRMLPFQSWEDLKDDLLLRFGDVADSDRIRFIAELDRFFADAISGEQKESKKKVDLSLGKIASQLKSTPEINTEVHVSDSENLRNIEPLAENSVLANLETVVKKAKIQKNIRMAVVNGDVERIQRVMSITKTFSAYQVFDKTSAHKERLKPKSKRKLNLSLKTWRFKFKNKILQRNRSICSPIRSSPRANFGYKWKEHNSRHWRRMRQTHMSRLLCNLRVRQDSWGLGQLSLHDLKSHTRHKWKSKHLREVFDLKHNPSYALDVVYKPAIECNNTDAILQFRSERTVSHGWHRWKHKTAYLQGLFELVVFDVVNFHSNVAAVTSISQSIGLAQDGAEKILWLLLFEKDRVMAADLGRQAVLEQLTKGVKHALQHTPFQRIPSVGTFVLLAQRVFQKLAAQLSKHFEILIKRIQPALYQLNCFIGSLWEKKNASWLGGVCVLVGIFLHKVTAILAELQGALHGRELDVGPRIKTVLEQLLQEHNVWETKTNEKLQLQLTQGMDLQEYADGLTKNFELEAALKEMVADSVTQAVLNLVTNAARFGFATVLTVLRVLCLLGILFWSTSFKKQKFGKNWWYKFKHRLWQRECGRDLLEVEVLVAEAVVKVKFDDVGRRELLIEWRDHDASETSWMFFKAFVHLYPSFKLEDKLGLQGESIVMNHQAYLRRKKEESESSNARGVSDANRGLLDRVFYFKRSLGCKWRVCRFIPIEARRAL